MSEGAARHRVGDKLLESLRAAGNAFVFTMKVIPTLPSRPLDWITQPPVVERLTYPSRLGPVTGDLYRPATRGPHPGIAVCLGVVPFGTDHPQVPRLGEALARSGFAALLYWSPAMRDLRLDPADVHDLALAYDALIARPDIDPARSGLLGTCVGGAFALMAAADPLVRDRTAFVAAFAPYSSMWTLLRDIASASVEGGLTPLPPLHDGWRGGDDGDTARRERAPWAVDPLTRRVFVRSMTALLDGDETERLRAAFGEADDGAIDQATLSPEGRAVHALLGGLPADEAEATLRALPPAVRGHIDALSPVHHLPGLRAPLVAFGHDADDTVVPAGESRRLAAALAGRPGMHYTEFHMFRHADPTKRHLGPLVLARELGRFGGYLYPVFRAAAARTGPATGGHPSPRRVP